MKLNLLTRPEKKYIGDLAIWEKSETALAAACKAAGKDYKVNPGDGAFMDQNSISMLKIH